MKIRFILALLAGLISAALLSAPSFAQKSKSVLATEVNNNFPDNSTGFITPAIVRTTFTDFINSWQQYTGVNPQTGTTYNVVASDYGQLVTLTNAAPVAVALPQATGAFSTFNIYVSNLGAGLVTITPVTSTINGGSTFTLTQNQAVWIISDGTNWQVWRGFGSGIVNPGTLGQLAWYAASASAVSGNPNATISNGALTLGVTGSAAGSVVLSGSSTGAVTLPGQAAAGTPTVTWGTSSGTPAVTASSPLAITTATGNATCTTCGVTGSPLSQFAATTSAQLAGVISDETGSGLLVFSTSPTFVTPVLGVAAATSINKVAFTAPASSATLTIADGKTLTASNSLTLAGTDSTTATFPSTNSTVASLNIADQALAGGANVTSLTQSTGSIQVDCGARPLQFITNGGAYTITAPASDGSCVLLSTNNGSAGAITFTGFSVGSNTGDALTTTNGSKFSIFIWRINGTSGYRIASHQ